jgi:predicted DNA-binding transcriptional regulator YafY
MIKLSIEKLSTGFDDNESCLEWLKNFRYPDGIECPVCRKITRHHKVTKSPCYACDSCGHQVYPAAGTIFSKSSTPLVTWFKLISKIYNSKENVSVRQIQKEFGVTYKTAWRMSRKIEEFLKENSIALSSEIKPAYPVRLATTRNKPATGVELISLVKTKDVVTYAHDNLSGKLVSKIDPYKEENANDYYWKRDRTARLLRLQILLWQNPQGISAAEIARKCLISKRTAYRDLRALESELGVPVWEEGNKRGMTDGYFLPPITFTVPEAFNIFVASRLLQKHSFQYYPSLAATFLKLSAVIPEPLKTQIQNSMDYLAKQFKGETKTGNLNKLVQAWLSRNRVQIKYDEAQNSNSLQDIIIEPYHLEPIYSLHTIFVIANCPSTKSMNTFKLDNIVGDVVVCPETYEIPTDFNAIDSINSAWGMVAEGELVTVKLHFKPEVSKTVSYTIWHPSQKLDLQKDGSIIATFKVRNLEDFRSWVFRWGNQVEVLEPEYFRVQMVDLLQELLAEYSQLPNQGQN